MASYRAQWDNGLVISWRDLSWEEYRNICQGVDPENIPANIAMQVYKTCILDGPSFNLVTAGIAYFVANHQIQSNPLSGDLVVQQNLIHIARSHVESNFLLYAQALIGHVFSIDLEEIRNWPAEKIFLRFAQAEIVTGKNTQLNLPNDKPSVKPKAKPNAREIAEQRFLAKNTKVQ